MRFWLAYSTLLLNILEEPAQIFEFFGEIKSLPGDIARKVLIREAVVSSLLSPRLKLPIRTPPELRVRRLKHRLNGEESPSSGWETLVQVQVLYVPAEVLDA